MSEASLPPAFVLSFEESPLSRYDRGDAPEDERKVEKK